MSQAPQNHLDQLYTSDPAVFARRYFGYLKKVLDGISPEDIARFVATILDARARGVTMFFIGNGGSAATASHFANDLAIGTKTSGRPFRVFSLNDNVSVLTALGNDYGHEDIFVRQLRALGRDGDVLVAISASGNSPNLIRAFEFAAERGIRTVAITAFDGGKLKAMADEALHVPTGPKEYGPAEDAHLVLNHLVSSFLMRLVKNE